MEYCDNCKYLKPKESEQTDKLEPHMCTLINQPVFHYKSHSRIPKPYWCEEKIDE